MLVGESVAALPRHDHYLYEYKIVTVRQEGFLSSLLTIHFFSKALVGEHRPLSFCRV